MLHALALAALLDTLPATAADRALVRQIFEQNVLPGWVRRCGARCGEVYNNVIAPISGVRFGG